MSKIFKKQNVMPVVVLGVICIVVALILGAVNMITSPVIEEAKNAAANEALLVVLPGAKNFEEIEVTSEFPAEVKKAHKADIGYVFQVDVKGKEAMTIMCGVGNDGKIVSVKVLSEQETPGYKDNVFPYVTGENGKYNGVDADTLKPELVSNATLTSTGVYNAVKASLNAFAVIGGGEIIEDEEEEDTVEYDFKTDEEVLALAKGLVGDENAEFTDVTPAGGQAVKKVYKNDSYGYVVYLATTSSQHNVIDTESVVYIDFNRTVKNIVKLTWTVGAAAPDKNYNPPSDDEVDAFYAGLKGETIDTIGEVDISTGATFTTKVLVDSVTEALVTVNKIIREDVPTSAKDVKAIAAEMAGKELSLVSFNLMKNIPYALKSVYSAGADGYFLYVVVPKTGEYVSVASEALIQLNEKREIVKVKLLSFDPENGTDPGDFEDRFVGKNKDTIASVALLDGAAEVSENFRTALKAAVTTVDKGTTDFEALQKLRMEGIVPNADGFEKLPLPENAAKTLKALYKVKGYDGYVAYVITSTQYVEVETEALVYVNAKGEVDDIHLVTWTVGHGVGAGDFPERLIGLNSKSLKDVELVTAATGTSEHIRDAVIDALNVIPVDRTPLIVAIIAAVLSVGSFVAYIVVIKSSRRRKN